MERMIEACSSLTDLNLTDSNITDEQLLLLMVKCLSRAPLKSIYLKGCTELTDEGIADGLKIGLPKVTEKIN